MKIYPVWTQRLKNACLGIQHASAMPIVAKKIASEFSERQEVGAGMTDLNVGFFQILRSKLMGCQSEPSIIELEAAWGEAYDRAKKIAEDWTVAETSVG
jgi:hypothetical protein